MNSLEDILKIRRNQYQLDCLIESEQIVPFVGAGMSCTFYPNWRDFLLRFDLLPEEKDYVKQLVDGGSFEEAASYICSISHRLFNDTVKDVSSPSHINESALSKAQLLLPSITNGMILTTNLDEVIEHVWKVKGMCLDAVITPDCEDQFNDAIITGKQTLIKLHGSVQESTKYVLTKEQYDHCYGTAENVDAPNSFCKNLRRAMQSKTILFLGNSLKSDRFLRLLREIAGWNEHIKHYALLSMPRNSTEATLRERELEKYGIFVIWFPEKQYDSIATIMNYVVQKKNSIRNSQFKTPNTLRKAPNTLPRDLSSIYGRDAIINYTISKIENKKNTSAVVITSFDGMPAIGKTTLAVKIAHMLSRKYPDAQLFIDCYGYTSGQSPLNQEQILDSLLFALNIPISQIPEKYEEKIILWRNELHCKSTIIIFDNVRYESQVHDLIPSSSDSLFIITSRNKLLISDSYSLEVDVISSEAAVLLLNDGKPESDAYRRRLLENLAKRYGNLPYALQITSRQIRGRGNKYIQRLLSNTDRFKSLSTLRGCIHTF